MYFTQRTLRIKQKGDLLLISDKMNFFLVLSRAGKIRGADLAVQMVKKDYQLFLGF